MWSLGDFFFFSSYGCSWAIMGYSMGYLIEIFGRHIASSTLPPAKRFLIVEADAKDIDEFPLEFFRKAAESPKYYIGGMPPAHGPHSLHQVQDDILNFHVVVGCCQVQQPRDNRSQRLSLQVEGSL